MNPAVTANIPKLDMLCAVFIASPIIFSSFLSRSTHFGEILAHFYILLKVPTCIIFVIVQNLSGYTTNNIIS